jgi:dTDP-4-amino-4,6-dideoxygalactose transaminase
MAVVQHFHITRLFSFIATANCIHYERATPVFVDIDEASLNLDPTLVARAVTGRTRAARSPAVATAGGCRPLQ